MQAPPDVLGRGHDPKQRQTTSANQQRPKRNKTQTAARVPSRRFRSVARRIGRRVPTPEVAGSIPAAATMANPPRGWTVLSAGPLADAIRSQMAEDPERYLPETWSIDPVGKCPCCDKDVYRCTTRHTKWKSGFATHGNVVHPSFNATTHEPDPKGTICGCCCVAPNWGPKHSARKPKKKARRSRR